MTRSKKRDHRTNLTILDDSGLRQNMDEQRQIAAEMVRQSRKMRKLADKMRRNLRKSA